MTHDPRGDSGGHGHEAPTYQGSRFPWWLALFWIGFAAWGVVYLMLWGLPDLRSWLGP